jgi:hypothetical protein
LINCRLARPYKVTRNQSNLKIAIWPGFVPCVERASFLAYDCSRLNNTHGQSKNKVESVTSIVTIAVALIGRACVSSAAQASRSTRRRSATADRRFKQARNLCCVEVIVGRKGTGVAAFPKHERYVAQYNRHRQSISLDGNRRYHPSESGWALQSYVWDGTLAVQMDPQPARPERNQSS